MASSSSARSDPSTSRSSPGALRVILGDQLTRDVSSLVDIDPDHDQVLMAEVDEEATYVRHHPKKIVLVFSAMRHFAEELAQRGVRVRYTRIDDEENAHSISGEVERALQDFPAGQIIATHPGEYRVLEAMRQWASRFDIAVDIRADDRFLVSIESFQQWSADRKTLRMETFYRRMRKRTGILMDGKSPCGGQWNFDASNRRRLPDDTDPPPAPVFEPDATTREVLTIVKERYGRHFGEAEPFSFAVTRRQALDALEDFVGNRLASFGDFQDAMKTDDPALFHSQLSFYLNIGLLGPREVIEAIESSYRDGHAPINAAEGFIRQVLGWREYVRGVYWTAMPRYRGLNALDARRALPPLYWGAETRMNCLAHCVSQTRRDAYAHHIQRLMVLGNFALLCGIDPDEVNEWYLVVYADAFEWVELPNVTGMILFADGGYLASKPYAAGGAYINRMSDYCGDCHYRVSHKTGDHACPFNYLYWAFLDGHRDRLGDNPRLAMPYRTLERMKSSRVDEIRDDARRFLDRLDAGECV